MKNDQFIEVFGKIEKCLNSLVEDNITQFPLLLKAACEKNPLIREFLSELNDFSLIRNLVSHKDRKEMIIIPLDTFNRLAEICRIISNPPTVFEKFGEDVFKCNINDKLAPVLEIMKEKVYTHVPVYQNKKFVGVISGASVVNWLTYRKNVDLSEAKVNDLGNFLEYQPDEFFEFVNESENAYLVREWFYNKLIKNKRLGAVFITKNGNKDEPLSGVITAWDLPLLNIRDK